MLFLAGVFAHLERLEAQAREVAVKQEKMKQEEEKRARLKARVRELRLQRDKLPAKVPLQKKVVRKGLLQRSTEGSGVLPLSEGGFTEGIHIESTIGFLFSLFK